MRQQVTQAIVLNRTDFGEADRILNLLTPDFGKLSLLAKGVRKVKSKLAGGIELFSVSEITFIKGRGEIGTLVSTRLKRHYGNIVRDLDRTMLGYELIKRLHKSTEEEPGPEYFDLLGEAFAALDDPSITPPVVRFWFNARLLGLSGYAPNLREDDAGRPLSADTTYNFSFDDMAFTSAQDGKGAYGADHIKFMRLAFAGNGAPVLAHVQGSSGLVAALAPLTDTMLATYLRV